MKSKAFIGLFLALALASAALGQDYRIVPAPPAAAGALPPALVALLQPQGERLLDSKNQPISEVWFVKALPASTNASAPPDVLYKNFTVGELVGALHLFSMWDDYRDQKIKPGYYTLRYALMPQDGNHMGVSPYPDFLLLSPVAADTHYGETLKIDDLLKLSRMVAGTGHPSVESLVPVNPAYKNLPAVVADDQGHVALQMKLTSGSGSAGGFEFALLLLGDIPQADGS
ncbi:MAG TPA: hypothetical protein VGW33_09710 [Terriglobia bacterium]|nr:hypothetical protein [Terriglobia bacterium]